jgi:hypothetical protein
MAFNKKPYLPVISLDITLNHTLEYRCTMLRKISTLAVMALALFTSCADIDRNIDAPRLEVELLPKGDLPLSAEQRSVTFVAKNGETLQVTLGSSLLVFSDCGTSWCPVGTNSPADASTYSVVDCNGGSTEVTVPEQTSDVVSFNYDVSSKIMLLDGVNFDTDTRVWASHNVAFAVVQEGQDMLLNCTECAGVFEGFEYVERRVRMRSFR